MHMATKLMFLPESVNVCNYTDTQCMLLAYACIQVDILFAQWYISAVVHLPYH